MLSACASLSTLACGSDDGGWSNSRAPSPEAGAPDSKPSMVLRRGGSFVALQPWARSAAGPGSPGCASNDAGPVRHSEESDRLIETLRTRYMATANDAGTPLRPPGSPPRSPAKYSLFPASRAESITEDCGRLTPLFSTDGSRIARRTTVSLPERADLPFELEEVRSGLRLKARLVGARSVASEISKGYVVYRDALPNGVDVIHVPTPTGTEDVLTIDGPETTAISYEVELGDKVAGLRLFANTLELLDSEGMPRHALAVEQLQGV